MADTPIVTSSLLKDAVASSLYDVLTNGAVVTDEEGRAARVTPSAAYFTAAIAYLKQHPPGEEFPRVGTPEGKLAEFAKRHGLPFGGAPAPKPQ